MRTCSHPTKRNGGHRMSRKSGAAISGARDARGANFLAANPTAKWPMNMQGIYVRKRRSSLRGEMGTRARRPRHMRLLQISPVRPDPKFHKQRHGQRVDVLHLLPNEGAQDVEFGFGDFEDEFIVHL